MDHGTILTISMALINSVLIPLGTYFFRSLRAELAQREDTLRELLSTQTASMDKGLDTLSRRITTMEQNHHEMELKMERQHSASLERYVPREQYTADMRAFGAKMDRVIQHMSEMQAGIAAISKDAK